MSESDASRDQQNTRPQNFGQVIDYRQAQPAGPVLVTFDRKELMQILALYGRNVAAGEWRDYAIDFSRDRAVFSVFRRSAEVPLYRIEKEPRLARKQGAYSVSNSAGLILKRGPDLSRVLQTIDLKPKLSVV